MVVFGFCPNNRRLAMITLTFQKNGKTHTKLFDGCLTLDAYIEALDSAVLKRADIISLKGTRPYIPQRAFGKHLEPLRPIEALFSAEQIPTRKIVRKIRNLIPRTGAEILYKTI